MARFEMTEGIAESFVSDLNRVYADVTYANVYGGDYGPMLDRQRAILAELQTYDRLPYTIVIAIRDVETAFRAGNVR